MKYEIVETIYEAKKNNGESLKVNKIRWGRGTKYDLRIWDEGIPLNGVIMSGQEMAMFATNIMKNEGIKAIADIQDPDFAPNIVLRDISLKTIVLEYPESLKDHASLKAFLSDMFPGQKREHNLLLCAYDAGIVSEIQHMNGGISSSDINRFLNRIENIFGIKAFYALWAVKTWAQAFQVKCGSEKYWKDYIEQRNRYEKKKEQKDTPNISLTDKTANIGTVVYDDQCLNLKYTKINKVNYLNGGPARELYFIVENKTDETMKVSCVEMTVDGFVNNKEGVIVYNLAPHSKTQDHSNVYESKLPGGFTPDSTVEFIVHYELQNSRMKHDSSSKVKIKL